MRIIIHSVLIVLIVLLLLPVSGWSMIASNTSGIILFNTEPEGIRFFFGTSIDIENGHMTYSIQGNDYGGWKSELEWPLDAITYIGETVTIGYKAFQTNIGIWKAVIDEAGDMKDRDWLFRYYGSDPFVYSESETAFDAMHVDLNLRYDFFQRERFALGAVLGYSYTKWDWEAGNGFQESIDPDYDVGGMEGIGITYEEKMQVPYVGLAVSFLPIQTQASGINIYGVYSPSARCEDEDDHILRYKLNTGESDGAFWAFGSDVRWQFSGSWSITGKLSYTRYALEGQQEQYFYADNPNNPDAPPAGTRYTGIDLTVEGSQVYVGVMVGYEF